jgi:hypothetical protein
MSSSCLPFLKTFFYEILVKLVEKTKHVYVLPKLGDCIFATISFDLWMSKEIHDIFSVVIFF